MGHFSLVIWYHCLRRTCCFNLEVSSTLEMEVQLASLKLWYWYSKINSATSQQTLNFIILDGEGNHKMFSVGAVVHKLCCLPRHVRWYKHLSTGGLKRLKRIKILLVRNMRWNGFKTSIISYFLCRRSYFIFGSTHSLFVKKYKYLRPLWTAMKIWMQSLLLNVLAEPWAVTNSLVCHLSPSRSLGMWHGVLLYVYLVIVYSQLQPVNKLQHFLCA